MTHLFPAIPCQRLSQALGESLDAASKSIDHMPRFARRQSNEHHIPRLAFNKCCDLRIRRTHKEITFPVSGNSTIRHFRRPFADRHSIHNLAAPSTFARGMPVTSDTIAPTPQMVGQLFLESPSSLHIQRAVNRLVRHVEIRPVRICLHQPPGDLFRRPVRTKLSRHQSSELAIGRQSTNLRSSRSIPRFDVSQFRAVLSRSVMAINLATNCRCRTIETPRDRTNRLSGNETPRDLFALTQAQNPRRPDTSGWRNSTMPQDEICHRLVVSAEQFPDIRIQRALAPGLPNDSTLSVRKRPSLSSSPHDRPPVNAIICCIHRLRPPVTTLVRTSVVTTDKDEV